MKYKVEITEVLQKIIEVDADNIEEALSIIKEKYRKEEIVLDDKDYIDTKIEIV